MEERYAPASPYFGLQVAITSPRLTDLFAVELNTSLSSTNIHSLLIREKLPSIYYHETVFTSQTLNVGMYVRYTLFRSTFAGYLHAGLQYYNHFYDITIYSDELRNNVVNPSVRRPAFDESKKGYVFNGGMSVMYKTRYFNSGIGVFYSPSLISNDLFLSVIDTFSVRFIVPR